MTTVNGTMFCPGTRVPRHPVDSVPVPRKAGLPDGESESNLPNLAGTRRGGFPAGGAPRIDFNIEIFRE